MKILSLFINTGIESKILDHLPIQLEGEHADELHAIRQAKVDALKVKMGDRYLLATSIKKVSNG